MATQPSRRKVVYRRTDPYGTEAAPFVVIAEYTHRELDPAAREDYDA